jgi:hypothetical protein
MISGARQVAVVLEFQDVLAEIMGARCYQPRVPVVFTT